MVRSKLFVSLALILALAILLSLISRCSDRVYWQAGAPFRPMPTIASLRNLLAQLPLNDRVAITGTSDRDSRVSLWGHYLVQMSTREIEAIYTRHMFEADWTLKESEGSPRERMIICNHGTAITIQWDEYYRRTTLSLIWTDNRNAAQYCP